MREAYNVHPNRGIALTTGDVYAWLADEGHFVRPPPPQPSLSETSQVVTVPGEAALNTETWFCAVCGLALSIHPFYTSFAAVKSENQSNVIGSNWQCDIIPPHMQIRSLPVFDVRSLIPATKSELYLYEKTPMQLQGGVLFRYGCRVWDYAMVVGKADPGLLLACHRLASEIRVLNKVPRPLLPGFTPPKKEVDERLAPYAILSLAVRSFVRQLVKEGLAVANRDRELAAAFVPGAFKKSKKKGQTQNALEKQRLLTPMHILRGIVQAGQSEEKGGRLALALGRMKIGGEMPLRLDESLAVALPSVSTQGFNGSRSGAGAFSSGMFSSVDVTQPNDPITVKQETMD